ncbi:hypothetical protein [Sorangium sp. So ce542]|uniref:hypothetical protein n=1 Tax=Sorangium sp. So ce542 TaxID=3133316 RepID=UPI003F5EE0E6
MNVKKTSTSIVTAAAIAVASSNAAAVVNTDRYSGFECEGNNGRYNWGPGTNEDTFYCPVLNWFPGGLADVTDVYVQMTVPHSESGYYCGDYYYGPSAKACVIYSSISSTAYGSACGLEQETLGGNTPGAAYLRLNDQSGTNYLDTWHNNHPLGAAYIVINEGGLTIGGSCGGSAATFRGYTVLSDI